MVIPRVSEQLLLTLLFLDSFEYLADDLGAPLSISHELRLKGQVSRHLNLIEVLMCQCIVSFSQKALRFYFSYL